jgi:hypothetical protein
MQRGALAASTAALETFREDEHTRAYLSRLLTMHKVVYSASSQTDLEKTVAKLKERGALFHLWMEQPEAIATAVALKPYPRSVSRALCKGLRLFK